MRRPRCGSCACHMRVVGSSDLPHEPALGTPLAGCWGTSGDAVRRDLIRAKPDAWHGPPACGRRSTSSASPTRTGSSSGRRRSGCSGLRREPRSPWRSHAACDGNADRRAHRPRGICASACDLCAALGRQQLPRFARRVLDHSSTSGWCRHVERACGRRRTRDVRRRVRDGELRVSERPHGRVGGRPLRGHQLGSRRSDRNRMHCADVPATFAPSSGGRRGRRSTSGLRRRARTPCRSPGRRAVRDETVGSKPLDAAPAIGR